MTTNKPVIAHFVRGYLSKTETFIGNQITGLQAFQPKVFCHHLKKGHSYPEEDVVSVTNLLSLYPSLLDKLLYKGFKTLSPAAARILVNKVSQSGAALLHFHYLVDARFFLEIKRKTGQPAVVSGYGYDVGSFPRTYLGYGKYYLRPIFKEMDLFLAMSHDMRQDLINLGCPAEKVVVHYYGTDTQRFAYPSKVYTQNETINILVVGTLEMKKAQHLVLEALQIAEKNKMLVNNFHLTLVGDGPMRKKLEQQVTQYGWLNKVSFIGFIPHHHQALIDAYRNADIFSLPSISAKDGKEGIPGTIVEAMAAGLPVLSTRHAGIPEIITSGVDGILVGEGDVFAMAKVFAELINHSELREKLGRAGCKRALAELDIEPKTRELEEIYHLLTTLKS
jgi:colanic acid/amylovoran biosynthesis glycosyltransferase